VPLIAQGYGLSIEGSCSLGPRSACRRSFLVSGNSVRGRCFNSFFIFKL